MTAKKGRGLLMVFADVKPEDEEEFNRWYNEEHIPERLAILGVLEAARYLAVQGGPKHLAYYEIAEPEAYFSDAWQFRLNNPTEWTQRMSPHPIGLNFVRGVYRLIYPSDVPEETAGAGMAPALVVGRMSVPEAVEEQFNRAYNTERIPACHDVPGYIRGRRFEAVAGGPKYLTMHELESAQVHDSTEWAQWRASAPPLWSETLRPHMTHAAGSPGVYTRIFPV